MTFISLVPDFYTNVKQYGAKGDGSTDDSSAISSAISAVNTAGGGVVVFPPGTYITGSQTLYSKVHLFGAGIESTIIQLKSGTNADLFSANTSSINLSASYGTGSTGGVYNFSIQNLTLDGNKAGQTAGPSYPLRFYGYGYVVENVRIRNGYSGGVLSDWNGGATLAVPADQMESQWVNVKIHDSGGIGLQFGGPHDSQFLNVISFTHSSHCFHFAPNCPGIQVMNAHAWGPATGNHAVAMLLEVSSGYYVNCEAEGSDVVQVVMLGSETVWIGGKIFAAGTTSCSGVQIGQQGSLTPYPGMIYQSAGTTTAEAPGNIHLITTFDSCQGTNGAIWLANDGNNCKIEAVCYQTSGNCVSGSGNSSGSYWIVPNGLTADGTVGKGGLFKLGINAYSAITANDAAGNDIWNLNTVSGSRRFEVVNGAELRGYSDAYSTIKFQLNPDGNGSIFAKGYLATGQSTSAASLASSGTIAVGGLGSSIVAPTAAVTGVILAAGTTAGQKVTVVNQSAFSITMAASGTSHCADGTSDVIAANNARTYEWNAVNSLWYPCK